MAGPGGGPSRRSHTKSRKGCKTCKKRHIRCDETFPQCRNCTKHQVRCDYMDTPVAGEEGLKITEQADLLWTPEIESAVQTWKATSDFPFPTLSVFPQPDWTEMSTTDLRLVYHLTSVCNNLEHSRISGLTIWTELMPRFLSAAASAPFAMHAVLAFAANHIAWLSQSADTRNLAHQYNASAMKGLHEALGSFSQLNADAVLTASILLSWQATDWRSWMSFTQSSKTMMDLMQTWRHESLFKDYLVENSILVQNPFARDSGIQIASSTRREHLATLQSTQAALQQIMPYLPNHDQEHKWVEQLHGYLGRLSSSTAPTGSDEQFSQLYALRKWAFWVPITLLTAKNGDFSTMLVLAHFYAVILAVEHTFPTIGPSFLANLALQPLQQILKATTAWSVNPGYESATTMMVYPQEILDRYLSRQAWARRPSQYAQPEVIRIQPPQQGNFGIGNLNIELGNHFSEYGYDQSRSPAFAPSPLATPSMRSNSAGSLNLSATAPPHSPFLEVPGPATSGEYSYSLSGALTSPLLSSAAASPLYGYDYLKQEEDASDTFNYEYAAGYGSTVQGGFVTPSYVPATVWT